MTDYLVQIKAMNIGETLSFPKELRNKINGLATRLFCHGRFYKVVSVKDKDYLTITRIE